MSCDGPAFFLCVCVVFGGVQFVTVLCVLLEDILF